MNILDLLIVYLACGAPFAVYRATTRDGRSRAKRIADVGFSLFCWPVLAIGLIKNLIVEGLNRETDVRELEELRVTIESKIFPDGSSSNVFEFRDAFYRMAGLERAGREKPSSGSFEIFQVSGHPNARLASRILSRTNLEKIKEHKTRADSEFAEILARSSTDAQFTESIISDLHVPSQSGSAATV